MDRTRTPQLEIGIKIKKNGQYDIKLKSRAEHSGIRFDEKKDRNGRSITIQMESIEPNLDGTKPDFVSQHRRIVQVCNGEGWPRKILDWIRRKFLYFVLMDYAKQRFGITWKLEDDSLLWSLLEGFKHLFSRLGGFA